MKCPHCKDLAVVMTERQGVAIDYYPQCRGAWLDRGELDKPIARGTVAAPAARPVYQQPARRPDFEDSNYHHNTGYGRCKPKSWLSEAFD